jgi:hypothetical protein
MKDRRTVLTIIALLVTLGCAGLLLSKVQNELASLRHFVGYEIFWWALVVLVLSYVRWFERRPLTSVGFSKPGIWNILIGIAAGIVLLASLAGIYFVLFPALHFKEDPQVTQVMSQMFAKPHWWRLTLILRGAVAEEILFRPTLSNGFVNLQEDSASPAFFPARSSPWSTWGFGAGAICSSPAPRASYSPCYTSGGAIYGST